MVEKETYFYIGLPLLTVAFLLHFGGIIWVLKNRAHKVIAASGVWFLL